MIRFLLTLTGSFIIWLSKGLSGQFNDHMVSYADRLTNKGLLRIFLGSGFWLIIAIVIGTIFSRVTKPTVYEVKKFENGKLELK